MARLVAAVATLGSGAPMGLEGPSLYAGARSAPACSAASAVLRDADRRVLLVAGAAAGVAAIFKAPATGAVFALEVPYGTTSPAACCSRRSSPVPSGYLVFVADQRHGAVVPHRRLARFRHP